MRGITAFLVLAAGSSLFVVASDIMARSLPGSKVLSMNFSKSKRFHSNTNTRRSKRGTVLGVLDNEYLLYFAEVTVGTPPQKLLLQIDTGSSDVWVPSATSDYCLSPVQPCTEGAYDPDSSSSNDIVERDGFQISYLDGSHAYGDYISETFGIGNITIENLQMGIGLETDIDAGIMGIGFSANVAARSSYPTLIDNLVSQGHINSRAYSLWLNDQESNTGSILFGGIDTEKFEGELIGVPVQLEKGEMKPTDFWVALDSVGFLSESGEEESITPNINLGVILDCGSSLTYLPEATVSRIAAKFGGVWSTQLDGYHVPCSLSENSKEFITYRFGGPKGPLIRIPAEELSYVLTDTSGEPYTDDNGDPICVLGIQPQPDDHGDVYIFGDTFLRSAYVVHDLDGSKIWMAQTIFNATASNIVEIQNSTLEISGVPDASGVASDIVVMPTATGTQLPRVGATRSSAIRSATLTGSTTSTVSTASNSTSTTTSSRSPKTETSLLFISGFSIFACVLGALTF